MAEVKEVHTGFMKVGLCPVGGEEIMDSQTGLFYPEYREKEFTLSDGSVMKQPFCEKHLLTLTIETLEWVWACIKLQWSNEIKENPQYTEEDREKELARITKLLISL